MAAPAPAPEARSATTIDSLPVEILTEVLLRVPTPAALVHAAAASTSWRGAIDTPDFLARYRKRHKSSPFLGLYVPRELAGPPSFLTPDSIRLADDGARDLKGAALRASDFGEIRRYQDHRLHDAFILGRLGVHPKCRLLDCHNSRLLLTRGDEALEVRSPLARESIVLPFPPDVVHSRCLEALLQGDDEAASSFRVVYLEHGRKGHSSRQARAVEYCSSRKSWQAHPWFTLNSIIEGPPEEVMHAGHLLFCIYRGPTQAGLVLDTKTMEFSTVPLPARGNFAIGEIEDNTCCLVESDGCADHRLKVWQLEEAKMEWELKKNVEMDEVLGDHVGYYYPCAVSNGIALLCSGRSGHHFVVNLNTCSTTEKFEFHGQSAYLMQMPWPPAFSACIRRTANAGVSVGECKRGSGSTIKFPDAGNQSIIDVSITQAPSLSDPSASESAEQRGEASQDCIGGKLGGDVHLHREHDLDIQDPTATAPTPATAEQCFGKDKNYVPDDYLIPDVYGQFSDLMHPKAAGGFDQDGGPASSVGNDRTGSGESDANEGLLGGTLAMASPPAAPAVEPEEPLLRVQSLNHDLLLQPPALARCPQQGKKRANSRESKGSPEAMGPERRKWKKPKFLEAIFARRNSFSIASKISDEVQIATSSCREASAASTAAVSAAECKFLLGGSSSTTNFTDSGKQPTNAPSLFVSTISTAAPEPTSKPTQEEAARPSRRTRKPSTKYTGEQWV